MRSHKQPHGSYIKHITENGYFTFMKPYLDGPPEEKVFDLKRDHQLQILKMKMGFANRYTDDSTIAAAIANRLTFSAQDKYCDTSEKCPLDFYANLKYLKKRPTDISIDYSVRNYIESTPQKDQIVIPDLKDDVVWIDLHKLGLKCDINLNGGPIYKKIKGVLLVQCNEFVRRTMPNLNSVVPLYQEKFQGKCPPYYAQVHSTDDYFYIFPLSKEVSFEELYMGEAREKEPIKEKSNSYALILSLLALEKIHNGEFIRDSKKYVERNLPLNKRPKKISKGTKFRQKYCEFRTTRYRHVESEQKTVSRISNPPEFYTPRNVRSHFKERWVTLEYIEKHNIPDEDIIDLEDRTRLYKKGEATKLWIKIKLWFEFNQDPNLEPTQEIERYRA